MAGLPAPASCHGGGTQFQKKEQEQRDVGTWPSRFFGSNGFVLQLFHTFRETLTRTPGGLPAARHLPLCLGRATSRTAGLACVSVLTRNAAVLGLYPDAVAFQTEWRTPGAVVWTTSQEFFPVQKPAASHDSLKENGSGNE